MTRKLQIPGFTTLIALIFAMTVSATANSAGDYTVTCQKTDEIKSIAGDMRAEFTNHLRKSRVYGQLMVRTVKMKANARKINRRARIQRNCDWRKQIDKIYEANCEIEALIAEAQLRASHGLDRPIDPACLTCIYQLIAQANDAVACLMVDGGFAQPVYEVESPALNAPEFDPGYAPMELPPAELIPELEQLPPPVERVPTPATPNQDSGPTLASPLQSTTTSQSTPRTAPTPATQDWGSIRAAKPREKSSVIDNQD